MEYFYFQIFSMPKFTGGILFFFFLGSSLFAQQNNSTTTHFNQADTIVIASEPDYPPYCVVDENGNAGGFSVELFKAAAEAVGLHVEIKIGIWNQIKNDLAEGKIDALPLVGRTPEREELYDFTMPYLSLHGAIFVREGTAGIQALEDLEGKKIAVMEGDNAEEFVRRENISDQIITTNTFEEAFRELAGGQYDAVITQRIMGISLLEQLELENVIPLDIQLTGFRQDFCFAVQKGDEKLLSRLNEGLSIVIANDTYESIRSKWFGPNTQEELTYIEVWRGVLFILIPLVVIMVVIWILFLRKEVKRRTKRLNNEIAEHRKTLKELQRQQIKIEKSEAQIRLLLNSTAEGIYALDKNGNCTMINQAGLEILSYTSRDQVLGKNMHNLIHHTRPDGTSCSIEDCKIFKAFLEGEGISSDDDIFWRSDGTSFQAEYFLYPIRQSGEVTGAVVTFWDISERKKAENELLHLKNELEIKVAERTTELQEKVEKLDKSQKAMLYMVEDLNNITTQLKQERRKLELTNQELEAFTYSVSHDLRSPLRAINGYANFLIEDYAPKLDAEGKRFIDTIRINATKMDRLISDLLNLSRVSRTSINYSKVDMKETAISMYHEIASAEEQSTFDFIVNEMPVTEVDLNLFKQVWQNLIGNALKYSSKSEIKRIEIGARKREGEIQFFVKDSGAGFNQKYKNKLFGVFQRLHKEDEFEGTGVGLALVKRIVHRHGGRVWAEGELNKGATFWFSLLQ